MAKKKHMSAVDASTAASLGKRKEKAKREDKHTQESTSGLASEPSPLDSAALQADVAQEELPTKKKKKRKLESEADAEPGQLPELESKKVKKKRQKVLKSDEPDVEPVVTNKVPQDPTSVSEQPAEVDKSSSNDDGNFELFVGGLPWSCSEKTLRKDFQECGEIAKLELLKDRITGKSRGMALITFKNVAAVDKALAYNGDEYGGRTLEVRRSVTKAKGKGKGKSNPELEVFIRGLGPKTKEAALEKEFAKCGEIEKVKMDIDIGDGGKCKGYAWITFKDSSGVEKALERNATEYGAHTITVRKCCDHNAGGKAAGKGSGEAGFEVFVRGLPLSTKESALKDDFLECGEISSLNMPKGNNQNCKGFAWITFKTREGAQKAVAYNGDDYGGNKLLVEIAGQHKNRAGKGKSAGGLKPAGCTSVVVKGVSYDATEADLNKAFANCGNGPVHVKLLTNWETGQSKGIAFVDFDSGLGVDEAMKLSGSQIKGRTVTMDYSKPRD